MSAMNHLPKGVAAEIAAKLAELQGISSDADMAERLGITRPHWSFIKTGRRRISYRAMKRAAAIFPELYPIVMRDLIGEPKPEAAA